MTWCLITHVAEMMSCPAAGNMCPGSPMGGAATPRPAPGTPPCAPSARARRAAHHAAVGAQQAHDGGRGRRGRGHRGGGVKSPSQPCVVFVCVGWVKSRLVLVLVYFCDVLVFVLWWRGWMVEARPLDGASAALHHADTRRQAATDIWRTFCGLTGSPGLEAALPSLAGRGRGSARRLRRLRPLRAQNTHLELLRHCEELVHILRGDGLPVYMSQSTKRSPEIGCWLA